MKAAAIDALAKLKNEIYKDLFLKYTKDSSYSVAGAALEALSELDGKLAFATANSLAKDENKGRLLSAITNVIIKYGDETAFDFVADNFEQIPLSQAKFPALTSFSQFLGSVTNMANFKKGVDMIVRFRDDLPQSIRVQTDPFINGIALKGLAAKKEADGAKEMADYVKSKLPAEKK